MHTSNKIPGWLTRGATQTERSGESMNYCVFGFKNVRRCSNRSLTVSFDTWVANWTITDVFKFNYTRVHSFTTTFGPCRYLCPVNSLSTLWNTAVKGESRVMEAALNSQNFWFEYFNSQFVTNQDRNYLNIIGTLQLVAYKFYSWELNF